MLRRALFLTLVMLAAPAAAQTPFEMPRADDRLPGKDQPADMPGTLDSLFGELLDRAQPHLDGLARDMGGVLGEYRPVLDELSAIMDDIGNYEMPPERLPNGDILIRRKAGTPPPPPLDRLPGFLPKAGDTRKDDTGPGATPTDPVPVSPQITL